MACIRLPTGDACSLTGAEVFVLGRGLIQTGPRAAEISRSQFSLRFDHHRGVVVTSLSTVNPTKVLFARPDSAGRPGVMLSTGQEQEMRAGDRALLLATAPETTAVEVVGVAAPPAERAAKAPAAAAPKRVRIDPAATATSPAPPGSDAGPSGSGGPPPVVLILVGVQGAGKSTFSQALLRRAPDRWARVNQDTIARGRPGSRAQCVTAARAALQRGVSVVVDRANVTPEQRAFFLEVARQAGVEAHCVALDLPLKACQARAAGRAEHEGGLQGQRAFAVVGMTHKALAQAGPPRREEGLSSVVTCRDDADADAAASAWAAYGPGCLEPWAEWERTRPQKKRGAGPGPGGGQQSLDQFFQRKTAAAAAQPSPRKPPPPSRRDSGASARTSGAGATADQQRSSAAPANAFAKLMAAAKHPPPPPPPPPPRGAAAPATRHSFRFAPALNALIAYADNPAAHPGSVLLADGACVVVADMYPKARAHALVVARSPRLQGPLDLQGPEDAALVRHMKEVGLRWAQEERARRGEDGRIGPWALGFHSVPSMRRLHLHVISRDFDAPSLKTKRHWNSFTTPFFLDVDEAIRQLEAGGLDYDLHEREALLQAPMRCQRCGTTLANMPTLKAHLGTCIAPL